MGATDTTRPEITILTGQQQDRVLRLLRRKRGTCRHCKGDAFIVGDALYLGFLFVSEDIDTYLVGLTCTNPACPAPHTGVRLAGAEFLDP